MQFVCTDKSTMHGGIFVGNNVQKILQVRYKILFVVVIKMRPDEGLAPKAGLGLPRRRANYLKVQSIEVSYYWE